MTSKFKETGDDVGSVLEEGGVGQHRPQSDEVNFFNCGLVSVYGSTVLALQVSYILYLFELYESIRHLGGPVHDELGIGCCVWIHPCYWQPLSHGGVSGDTLQSDS